MQKILLIDDEKKSLENLTVRLKQKGYNVYPAQSGSQGLDLYKKHTPSIVITDLRMPGMDGLEVLKEIKHVNHNTEVIIITGHGDMNSAIEALEYGASDFLNKPILDNALSVALERASERLLMKLKIKEYTDDLENMINIATKEVKRKSDFQAKLICSSNNGIVATDENGEIVIYNPGAENIFGYRRVEVVNKKIYSDLYPEDIADDIKHAFNDNEIIKKTGWRETVIKSKFSEIVPVSYFCSILHEHNRVMGSVAFFQDLREIKRLEEELIKSEKLASVGQTVASLAHYIKNILTGLKGGSYVVNIGIRNNDIVRIDKGWEMVQNNINRISDLVMDLLTYSKKREPEPVECSPNNIIAEICELMDIKARQIGIELVQELDSSISEVLMDEKTVHGSMLNLITNAIDACIFDENRNKKWKITVKTARSGNEIICQVKDNGCGMTDEVKKKIFSCFFSTKMGKGTGLGLLTTKKMVEEHGGKIEFSSAQNQGSTFTVYLPFRTADSETAHAPEFQTDDKVLYAGGK